MVANAFINILLEHAAFIIWEKLEFLLFNSWVLKLCGLEGYSANPWMVSSNRAIQLINECVAFSLSPFSNYSMTVHPVLVTLSALSQYDASNVSPGAYSHMTDYITRI